MVLDSLTPGLAPSFVLRRRAWTAASDAADELVRRPRLALIAALMAVSAVFVVFPGLDLRLSDTFYRDGMGFWLAEDARLRLVRSLGNHLTMLVVVACLVAAFAPFVRIGRHIGLRPHQALFVLAVYALGPGLLVNGILKNVVGRARPREIWEFGGGSDFTGVWTVFGGCLSNCSFVSGEGASAFALLCLIFVAPRGDRLTIGPSLFAVALALSLNRIAFGGHFLSDVLIAWILVLFVAVSLRPVFLGRWGPRIDGILRTAGRQAIEYRARLIGRLVGSWRSERSPAWNAL
ncbi:phosphatase PAP2 family protein [Consotaella aegiceratis]|uniref:phosphatase PAP2 family protein n=1 Tax=Consotaella aegiceratis TaxID=3097961 RepID=UPI002F424802